MASQNQINFISRETYISSDNIESPIEFNKKNPLAAKGRMAKMTPKLYTAQANSGAEDEEKVLRNDIPGNQDSEWRKNCADYDNEELLGCISNFAGMIEKEKPVSNVNYNAVAVSRCQVKLKVVIGELNKRIKEDPFKLFNSLNSRGKLSVLFENILKLHDLKKLFPKNLQEFYQRTVIDKSNEFVSEFVLRIKNSINKSRKDLLENYRFLRDAALSKKIKAIELARKEDKPQDVIELIKTQFENELADTGKDYNDKISKLGQDYGGLIGAIYSASINKIAPRTKVTVLWNAIAENVTLDVDSSVSPSFNKGASGSSSIQSSSMPDKAQGSTGNMQPYLKISSRTNVIGLITSIQAGIKKQELDEKLKSFGVEHPLTNIECYGEEEKLFFDKMFKELDSYLKQFYVIDYTGIIKTVERK